MSHKHKKHHRFCNNTRYFHDIVGEGALDSTPIAVPAEFGSEVGSENHPGPFAGQSFHPSSQLFLGLLPRRNTPNKSPEKAGKVIMDDKKHGKSRFYKPRIKDIHKKSSKKKD